MRWERICTSSFQSWTSSPATQRPGDQEEDVAAVVGVRRVRRWLIFSSGRGAQCIESSRSSPAILSQPKTSGVQLVMALTVQTIALAWGKARHKEGLSQSRLQSEYFELLKQSKSAFTGRPWGTATATWSRSIERWSAESLERALQMLLDADTR